MSLQIVWDKLDAVFRPAVICDHCGAEIMEGKQGNYEWVMDDDGKIKDGMIYFTHKECCYPFEMSHGGRAIWYAGELDLLPLYMANVLKVDMKKAKEWARLLSGL